MTQKEKQKKNELNIDFGENQKGTVLKFQHFEDENEEDYYELWDMKIGIVHIYNLIQQGIIVEIQEPEFTEADVLEMLKLNRFVTQSDSLVYPKPEKIISDFRAKQANKKEIETQW